MTPPSHLDGARLLAWAWSDLPFGHVAADTGADADAGTRSIAIHGLALCQYAGDANVYRFSCDAHWETVQDACYASEENAREQLPAQYRAVAATWHKA